MEVSTREQGIEFVEHAIVSPSASTNAIRAPLWRKRRSQHRCLVVGPFAHFAELALIRASKSPMARVNAPMSRHENIHRDMI